MQGLFSRIGRIGHMTRTRTIHLLVILFLIGIGTWIAMNTYWTTVTVSSPPEGDAAVNPYYSVQHLSASVGIHTRLIPSLPSPPLHGGVLLINGIQDEFMRSHMDALEPWVRSGGRLIVTGDVIWASAGMQAWSGLSPGSRLVQNQRRPPMTRLGSLDDSDCEPMTVKADGVPTGESLTLCAPESQFEFVSKHVPAWSLLSDCGIQVLRVNIGRGTLTVIPRMWLIGNKTLLRHDHARIFIESAQLRRADELTIVSPLGRENLLALLWRLIAPAIVFFALAILCAIARHLPRFDSLEPVPAAVRRSLAEQIRANAAFAWRTRKLKSLRAAVGRALDETAQRRIPAYGTLDLRRRVTALAEQTGVDLKSLNAAMTEDAVGPASVQRSAIAFLENTRRILKIRTQPTKRQAA
jgi:hypothetical protein